MVLLIIIPFLNGHFIGNIPNIFRQTQIVIFLKALRAFVSLFRSWWMADTIRCHKYPKRCSWENLGLTRPGKLTKSYGKSPFLMGKSTISMAIFNSYVTFTEVYHQKRGFRTRFHQFQHDFTEFFWWFWSANMLNARFFWTAEFLRSCDQWVSTGAYHDGRIMMSTWQFDLSKFDHDRSLFSRTLVHHG